MSTYREFMLRPLSSSIIRNVNITTIVDTIIWKDL